MLIMPPPEFPWWASELPQAEREALEASYRAEHDRWSREARTTMLLNLAWPVLLIGAVVASAWAAGMLADTLLPP